MAVPDMLAEDMENGFAIISDLGGEAMADAIVAGADEHELYTKAAGILNKLRAEPADPHRDGWPVQTYDRLAYETEARLLQEWYLPKELGITLTKDDEEALMGAWRAVFSLLSAPLHYVHRDFHAENLLVTGEGLGVIDFQDMMIGQAAYDWASLIEDARRDVGEDTAEAVYRLGVQGADDAAAFETDYAVLAAQRNAKILGLFTRLIHDVGKPRYRSMMNRVKAHLRADLARPPLAPVREVLMRTSPELFTS
jgi:aminoglycoside/choline kinase family phosphotransferase